MTHDGLPFHAVRFYMRAIERAVDKVSDFMRHRLRDKIINVLSQQHWIKSNQILSAMRGASASAPKVPQDCRQFERTTIKRLRPNAHFNDLVFDTADQLIGWLMLRCRWRTERLRQKPCLGISWTYKFNFHILLI